MSRRCWNGVCTDHVFWKRSLLNFSPCVLVFLIHLKIDVRGRSEILSTRVDYFQRTEATLVLLQRFVRQRSGSGALQLEGPKDAKSRNKPLSSISRPKAVEIHKYRIMDLLGVRTVADLTRYAMKRGIVA
jgi:hypothetical protein